MMGKKLNQSLRWVIAVFLLVALMMPSLVALAQTGSGQITGVSRLNVRSGPGSGYPVVVILDAGANVTLIGRNGDASWVNIQLAGGVQGWVNARYVTANIAIASLPVSAQGTAASATVNAYYLNVRTGPGVGFAIIGPLGQGDGVSMIGRNADASWVEIVLPNGTHGWVNSGWLIPSIPVINLPITDGQGGGTTNPPSGAVGVVTAFFLNVRSGPAVTYPSFARLSQNDAVNLVGRNADGSWVQLALRDGRQGWVNAGWMRLSVAVTSLPITDGSSSGSPLPPPPGPNATVTAFYLNVRYGPSSTYGAFTRLARDQVVSLVGRNASGTWVQIQIPAGASGWVNANYLIPSVAISTLPVTG
ncbi:MAG: SH3 domain-containing protein [Anaerolineae bacterium]|nr:SH3 domain-containing protein [Anaerolineae bacterium]